MEGEITKMKDVMVDIETLGTKPGCVTLSIGAVLFDPCSFDLGQQFYLNINVEDSHNAGFFSDPQTVKWWEKQSQEAKDHLVPNQYPVKQAMKIFADWFKQSGGEKPWSHGAPFDITILEHALSYLEIPIPWKYYNVRDTRTVFDLYQFDVRNEPRNGTHHNALDDARFQAICIQKALNKEVKGI